MYITIPTKAIQTMKTKILLTAFALFFGACSNHPMDPKVEFAPPKYVEQMPEKDTSMQPISTGSLYSAGSTSLYGDRMAMHVNDIVTVLVKHNTSSASSDSKKLSRTNEDTLGGGTYAGPLSMGINGITGGLLGAASGMAFSGGSTNEFSGQGQTKKTDTFTTTITARVIKIMPNDTYFIDGTREILLNGEKQILKVSGVIRRQDIDQTNTINADRLSDAKIAFYTEGDIARNTTVPWGAKVMETIWPF